jgi:ketopantoate hydroxymethyltransferase
LVAEASNRQDAIAEFKKHRRDVTRMAANAGNEHTEAVFRGAAGRVIVADVPFLFFREGLAAALDPGTAPHVAGAHAGRLESRGQ